MTVVMGAYVSWVALTFIGLLGYAAGLYLTWHYAWRHVDHAVCRQCGYDLRGLKGLGAVCPECGQTLARETVECASKRFARRPIQYAITPLLVASSFLLGLCALVGLLRSL